MNKFGLSFHHLGLATKHEKMAILFLEGSGYQVSESIFDPLQNVNLIMASHSEQPSVEIVYAGEKTGPLTDILQTQESLIYHTCFETLDYQASLAQMKQAGLRVLMVSEPKPAVLFDGQLVSFHMVRGVGLVELLHHV
ncbi:VOC family protein [Motilimonas pumila]|uniref:VOC domain-containing protein n=1 Tax=Motilimonas pumila TaxID=2303987 RepID=A0A418YGP8_9GAMM|nr:VOC family protein [Motilimonas pumila]RJG49010.1 hypothetical protein D1Z90_06475 [Motilimonas pumila]